MKRHGVIKNLRASLCFLCRALCYRFWSKKRILIVTKHYFAVTPFSFNAAWAAARRAIGTRKGEQLT